NGDLRRPCIECSCIFHPGKCWTAVLLQQVHRSIRELGSLSPCSRGLYLLWTGRLLPQGWVSSAGPIRSGGADAANPAAPSQTENYDEVTSCGCKSTCVGCVANQRQR